jgi:penicillin-binding protein 2
MSALQQLIPSMFVRRLMLLMIGMLIATLVLLGQTARLTVVHGAENRAEAERVLVTRQLVPTVRGSIVDRKGRVLAEDRPCYDISVDYPVITGEWAYKQARLNAKRDAGRDWAKLSFDEREALIERYREPFDAKLNQLWRSLADLGTMDAAELERRKQLIINRVQVIRGNVFEARERRRAMESDGPVEESSSAPVTLAEETAAHPVLTAVDDEVAFRVRKLITELPGLHVVPSRARWYPNQTMEVELKRDSLPGPIKSERAWKTKIDSLAVHVLGTVGEVGPEDVDVKSGRPFYRGKGVTDLWGYLPGDLKGVGGVEQAEEWRLRGRRGQLVKRNDTGEEDRDPPIPGKDVQLSIDLELEAKVRALLDPQFGLAVVQPWHNNKTMLPGTPLFGTVVVMEVDTGEVLAAVSTPVPPARVPGQPYPDLGKDKDRPLLNRAISGVYAPGSTMKPIVYCIAATNKAIGWDEAINCQGALDPNHRERYQCWYWKQYKMEHGPLAPPEAIARSCNVFFNTCGQRLGADALVYALHQWGFGEYAGVGLPAESKGLLAQVQPTGRTGLSIADGIHMGIGQGPIAVTPLQLATAHAALARGGYYLSPILIRQRAEKQVSRELNLPPRVVANALQGMYESANADYGSGFPLPLPTGRERIINIEGLTVRAKTGTAAAPTQYIDENGNGKHDPGEPIEREGDHSWYVAHVQRKGEDRAKYIVVVLVEYGGSGGRVSGPISNQVLHVLRDYGYL